MLFMGVLLVLMLIRTSDPRAKPFIFLPGKSHETLKVDASLYYLVT